MMKDREEWQGCMRRKCFGGERGKTRLGRKKYTDEKGGAEWDQEGAGGVSTSARECVFVLWRATFMTSVSSVSVCVRPWKKRERKCRNVTKIAHTNTFILALSLFFSWGSLSAVIDYYYRTRISTKRLAAPKMRNRCVWLCFRLSCVCESDRGSLGTLYYGIPLYELVFDFG